MFNIKSIESKVITYSFVGKILETCQNFENTLKYYILGVMCIILEQKDTLGKFIIDVLENIIALDFNLCVQTSILPSVHIIILGDHLAFSFGLMSLNSILSGYFFSFICCSRHRHFFPSTLWFGSFSAPHITFKRSTNVSHVDSPEGCCRAVHSPLDN